MALEPTPVLFGVFPTSGNTAPDNPIVLILPRNTVIIPTGEALLLVPVHGRREENLVVGLQLGAAKHGEEGLGGGAGERPDEDPLEPLEIGLVADLGGLCKVGDVAAVAVLFGVVHVDDGRVGEGLLHGGGSGGAVGVAAAAGDLPVWLCIMISFNLHIVREKKRVDNDLLVSSQSLGRVTMSKSPWPGGGSFCHSDFMAVALPSLTVLAAFVMKPLMSSHGTTSLGSSMALSAISISGNRCSTVLIMLSQICVQNQSLPAVATPFRTLMTISKSQDSLRITAGFMPQYGSRS